MASLPTGTPDHYVVSRNAPQRHNLGLRCALARKGLQRFIMRSLYVGQELHNERWSSAETGLTVAELQSMYGYARHYLHTVCVTPLPVI